MTSREENLQSVGESNKYAPGMMTKTLVVILIVKIANLSFVANAMLHLRPTPNTSNTTTRIIIKIITTIIRTDKLAFIYTGIFKGLIDLSIDRLLKGFLAL